MAFFYDTGTLTPHTVGEAFRDRGSPETSTTLPYGSLERSTAAPMGLQTHPQQNLMGLQKHLQQHLMGRQKEPQQSHMTSKTRHVHFRCLILIYDSALCALHHLTRTGETTEKKQLKNSKPCYVCHAPAAETGKWLTFTVTYSLIRVAEFWLDTPTKRFIKLASPLSLCT